MPIPPASTPSYATGERTNVSRGSSNTGQDDETFTYHHDVTYNSFAKAQRAASINPEYNPAKSKQLAMCDRTAHIASVQTSSNTGTDLENGRVSVTIDRPEIQPLSSDQLESEVKRIHRPLLSFTNNDNTDLGPLRNSLNPDIIRQPDSHPITSDQLETEVKAIYSKLVVVEAKCMSIDNAKLATNEKCSSEESDKWQAMLALHRTLLYEHHDFLSASQHPAAQRPPRKLALKRSMPARTWKHGIHSFLEVLRRRLPDSLDYTLLFIYRAYRMSALLYETVEPFKTTWVECLEDLARYRMAIEDGFEPWGVYTSHIDGMLMRSYRDVTRCTESRSQNTMIFLIHPASAISCRKESWLSPTQLALMLATSLMFISPSLAYSAIEWTSMISGTGGLITSMSWVGVYDIQDDEAPWLLPLKLGYAFSQGLFACLHSTAQTLRLPLLRVRISIFGGFMLCAACFVASLAYSCKSPRRFVFHDMMSTVGTWTVLCIYEGKVEILVVLGPVVLVAISFALWHFSEHRERDAGTIRMD